MYFISPLSLGAFTGGEDDVFACLKWAFSASIETEAGWGGGKGYMEESLLYLYK